MKTEYLSIETKQQREAYERSWSDSISEINLTEFIPELEDELTLLYFTKRGCIPCYENERVLDSVRTIFDQLKIFSFYSNEEYLDTNSFENIGVQSELAAKLMCYATPTLFIVKNGRVCNIKTGGPGLEPNYEYHIDVLTRKLLNCR